MTPTKDQQAQEYAEKKMENVYSQEWDSEYVEGLIECAFKDGADFALGKQTETIAQEDIGKAAEAFATPPIGNGGMFTREQVKELLVRFAQLLLSKQEKDAEATSAASPKTTPASSAGTATNSAKNEKRNTAELSILQ